MNEPRYRAAEAALWADAGATPRERFIKLPRIGSSIRIQEVGEGPPALFIHGGPSAGSGWAPLAAKLPELRCIVIDRPGTGLSEAARPTNAARVWDFFDDMVLDVLDVLAIDRAHLVGSSTGGGIALVTAGRHPERVDRMAQIGCPDFVEGLRLGAFDRLMSLPGLRQLIARMPMNEKSIRSSFRGMGHGESIDAGRLKQAHVDWAVSLYRDTPTMGEELASASAYLSLRGADPRTVLPGAFLRSIQAPTLLLWGEHDSYGGVDLAQRLAATLPDTTLEVMPGAGHLPWFDDADHVAAVVRRHLMGDGTEAGVIEAGVPAGTTPGAVAAGRVAAG
jgi:2-hydroxy-6-oxonona-2,4-dienedioate hydrolase